MFLSFFSYAHIEKFQFSLLYIFGRRWRNFLLFWICRKSNFYFTLLGRKHPIFRLCKHIFVYSLFLFVKTYLSVHVMPFLCILLCYSFICQTFNLLDIYIYIYYRLLINQLKLQQFDILSSLSFLFISFKVMLHLDIYTKVIFFHFCIWKKVKIFGTHYEERGLREFETHRK